MKRMINSETIQGRLYEHNLSIKKVKNEKSKNFGKDFINGTISIAIDDKAMNVIQIHYTYVTEETSSGKRNQTYFVLKKIIDEGKTWVTDGPEEAMKLKAENVTLTLNDFYANNDTLVSQKRNEGGFLSIIKELEPGVPSNYFEADMLVTKAVRKDPESANSDEKTHVIISGYIFNFRGEIFPMDFRVEIEDGMGYFTRLDLQSKPLFTKVWGNINNITEVKEVVNESAFGEATVTKVKKNTKQWICVGSSPKPYELGNPAILTLDEVTQCLQNRDIMLADVKKNREEWEKSKIANNSSNFSNGMNMPIADGGFNF